MALSEPTSPQPYDRPGASSTSSFAHSHLHRLVSRTTLKIATPLVVIGAASAVAFAASGGATNQTEVQTKTDKNGTTQVTVTHSSNATTPKATPSTTSTTLNSSTSSNSGGQVHTDVTVNGRHINVPANGTVSQTVTSPDGSTSFSLQTTSTSTGSAQSSTSTDVNISNSSSTSSGDYTWSSSTGESM